MKYNNLLLDIKEKCLTITINRPKYLNVLNKETIEELSDVLDVYHSDDAIRVVVITGEGDKAFVAGADIKEFIDYSTTEGEILSKEGQQKVFDKIEHYSKPVIAKINGYALGGGLELALACHLRIASEKSKFGFPEVSLGLIPGYGGTQRLPQLIGKTKAMEMILTGDMINAEEAISIGLLNKVTLVEELNKEVDIFVNRILKNAPNSISKVITVMNDYLRSDGFQKESNIFGSCFRTEDFKIGTQAFVNKEKPKFN